MDILRHCGCVIVTAVCSFDGTMGATLLFSV